MNIKVLAVSIVFITGPVFAQDMASPPNSLVVNNTGDIGIGTDTPDESVHVVRDEASATRMKIENVNAGATVVDIDLLIAANNWRIRANGVNGQLNFIDNTNSTAPFRTGPGAQNNLFQVGVVATDRVDIVGDLVVTGSITPDYVFEQDFELESIEEHADYMWKNKHLKAVGPAQVGEDGIHRVNIASRSQGALEELEKAHIYISQLNEKLLLLESKLAKLQEQVASK